MSRTSRAGLAGCLVDRGRRPRRLHQHRPARRSDAAGGGGPIAVTASDDACEVAAAEAPAGTITFSIDNTGTQGHRVLPLRHGRPDHGRGREHRPRPHPRSSSSRCPTAAPTPPPASRAWSATASARRSRSPARPRGPWTRTPGSPRRPPATSATSPRRSRRWCRRRRSSSTPSRPATSRPAKALFPVARTYWERIEPVAESFGDIDPKIDGREDDERDPGVQFTGYHRLEKDLWVDGLQPDSPRHRRPADGRHHATSQSRAATVELTPGAAGQRGEGAARRGRHRQDHRRGGPLLAHRPLGLQGQRRGLAGRGRRAPAGDRREGPDARPGARRALRGRRRRCWRSTAPATGSSSTPS